MIGCISELCDVCLCEVGVVYVQVCWGWLILWGDGFEVWVVNVFKCCEVQFVEDCEICECCVCEGQVDGSVLGGGQLRMLIVCLIDILKLLGGGGG